jgi:hypothetical protein
MEFRVGNYTYRARAMNAFAQMDILALLGPTIATGVAELMPIFAEIKANGADAIINRDLSTSMAVLAPAMRSFAAMPPKDRHFILATCLSLCERKADNAEGWMPIWNVDAGRSMFDDINDDLSTMLPIVLNILKGTFKNFTPASLLI